MPKLAIGYFWGFSIWDGKTDPLRVLWGICGTLQNIPLC